MGTLDFHRSFFTFRIDSLKKQPKTVSHKPPQTLNNARIPIECRCLITEKGSGETHEFFLGANCKTERVGVDRDIWTEPNADFIPICSRTQWLVLKAFDRADKNVPLYPPSLGVQPERQLLDVEEAFDSLRIDPVEVQGEALETAEEVVEAVLANRLLNAKTQIETDQYVAVIDYPVRTINANERDMMYQTDTGPILFPDLTREPGNLIDGMNVAFSAFNEPTWIEMLLRVPTPLEANIRVHHYSKSIRQDAKNQIIALP